MLALDDFKANVKVWGNHWEWENLWHGSFGLSDTVWEDLEVIIDKQAASLDK